jgi:hypothetical protein
MEPNEQQDKRQATGERKGWIAEAAPIAAQTILAAGQIIAAKVGNGKDKGGGDGKS